MSKIVFRSKIDTWVGVVIYATAAIGLGGLLLALIVGPLPVALAVAPLLLVGSLLPVWFLRATYYVVEGSKLYVRSGPFRWVVPIDEIHSVKETRDPLSSPALSLDRLRIAYGRRRTILISPQDKAAFLSELDRRRQDLDRRRS